VKCEIDVVVNNCAAPHCWPVRSDEIILVWIWRGAHTGVAKQTQGRKERPAGLVWRGLVGILLSEVGQDVMKDSC